MKPKTRHKGDTRTERELKKPKKTQSNLETQLNKNCHEPIDLED
jgi:hypothetical protein